MSEKFRKELQNQSVCLLRSRKGAGHHRGRLASPAAAASDRLPIMADDDLTESIVRRHLRDQPGEVSCALWMARVPNLDLSATESALAALAERRPPFAPGRCDCGGEGLKLLLR